MISIKGGNYHTLTELALRLASNPRDLQMMKTRISRIARRLKLGIYLNRLMVRYHDEDVQLIILELQDGKKK